MASGGTEVLEALVFLDLLASGLFVHQAAEEIVVVAALAKTQKIRIPQEVQKSQAIRMTKMTTRARKQRQLNQRAHVRRQCPIALICAVHRLVPQLFHAQRPAIVPERDAVLLVRLRRALYPQRAHSALDPNELDRRSLEEIFQTRCLIFSATI